MRYLLTLVRLSAKNILLSAIVVTGCSAVSDRVARSATPGAVEAGLESATEPRNRERVQSILEDTTLKTSVADIRPEAVDSVLSQLASPKNEQNLRRITGTVASQILKEVAAPPSPAVQKQKEALVTQSTKLAVTAATEELRRTLPDLIAATARDPRVSDALAPLSRTAADSAAKGVGDAVTGKSDRK